MALNNMNEKQMEDLMQAYRNRQAEDAWNTRTDYDRALMRQMQDELQHYWDFQTWLRFTHPDVIQEYKAVKDVERSANNGL